MVAVTQGARAAAPVQQMVVRLHLLGQLRRPGNDALTKALKVRKAPGDEGQHPACGDRVRQRANQRLPLHNAGDVVQKAEADHQIERAGGRRFADQVASQQLRVRQSLAGDLQHFRAVVNAGVAHGAQMLRQEVAEAAVAAADIEHARLRR